MKYKKERLYSEHLQAESATLLEFVEIWRASVTTQYWVAPLQQINNLTK